MDLVADLIVREGLPAERQDRRPTIIHDRRGGGYAHFRRLDLDLAPQVATELRRKDVGDSFDVITSYSIHYTKLYESTTGNPVTMTTRTVRVFLMLNDERQERELAGVYCTPM